MAEYHKYVFDLEKRTFIGDFETMYQQESVDNFDSWHQDDTRQLQRKIDLTILEDYNFNKIIDKINQLLGIENIKHDWEKKKVKLLT